MTIQGDCTINTDLQVDGNLNVLGNLSASLNPSIPFLHTEVTNQTIQTSATLTGLPYVTDYTTNMQQASGLGSGVGGNITWDGTAFIHMKAGFWRIECRLDSSSTGTNDVRLAIGLKPPGNNLSGSIGSCTKMTSFGLGIAASTVIEVTSGYGFWPMLSVSSTPSLTNCYVQITATYLGTLV